MASTYTAATAFNSPHAPHTGVQAQLFRYSSGSTQIGTSSDVVILCKIPNDATLLDVRARVVARNDGGAELRVYLTHAEPRSQTSTLAVLGSLSVSVTVGTLQFTPSPGFAPFRLSITDAYALQYAWLKIMWINAASATASFSIDGYVMYAMNMEKGA